MAAFQMTDSQQVSCTLGYTDRRGNPTGPPPGATAPQWLVDTPAVLTLAPAADGQSCVVTAAGPLGTATVSVKVTDAQGNPLASGSLDFTIVGGAPSQMVVTPGTPTEQP